MALICGPRSRLSGTGPAAARNGVAVSADSRRETCNAMHALCGPGRSLDLYGNRLQLPPNLPLRACGLNAGLAAWFTACGDESGHRYETKASCA